MAKIDTSPFAQNNRTFTAVAFIATPATAAAGGISTDSPNSVYLCTAGGEGALLTKLGAMPRGSVTATGLYLFIRKAADIAATRRLRDSELMGAYTITTTTQIPETVFTAFTEATPMRLEAGDELHVGIGVANAAGIVFTAELSDF